MAYTPVFTPTYEDGWEDLPLETTPITAEALNNYDEAIENIEEYLAQGGGGGGETNTDIIAPEYDDTLIYHLDDYVIYDSKLYRCIDSPASGTFDPNDWNEVSVMDEMTSEVNYLSVNLSHKLPEANIGFINTSTLTAQKAFARGELFYMEEAHKAAIALTDIALNDPLTLNTNYKYTTISEALASGGGGSKVEITPTLQSGTKIADFEIDGVPGALYAPAGGGSANIWTGTRAEYEAQASQIADGTLVNITDDEEEIAIAESESF